ncbi:MAG: elongation factor G [Alphaproteobacteria bacterium]|nr:elongation factor G [Alphaproteobacteria bacterium]
MPGTSPAAPRVAALVGPYLSGKTTLMESLLYSCGAIDRRGNQKDKNTVGDASPEAKSHGMSVEISAATGTFLGETWHFLDCPGSVEFWNDTQSALMVADVAVIVCDPEIDRALTMAPLFHFLDEHEIPHMIFINKLDHTDVRVRDLMEALQGISSRKLVLREVPIRDGESISGYVDLISERAYKFKEGEQSDLISIPGDLEDREVEARQSLLESLADFDDGLLEQLLEDTVPEKQDIYSHMTKDLADDLIVPVFLGAAEHMNGVQRLMKALRHETPDPRKTRERLGGLSGDPLVQVFKTYHMPHTGKTSLARIWDGSVKDGMSLGPHKISGLFHMIGHTQNKIASAGIGDIVAMGRMDEVSTGDLLGAAGTVKGPDWPAPAQPIYSFAITPKKREDEVKLSAAIAKLADEDSSVTVEHNPDTNEMVLWGQGDIHLQVATERLANRYNVAVDTRQPLTPYKETIRRGTKQHARHKKQSGGHGQFGDVHIEIKPLPRGSGFQFTESITGGAVPRQYIPAVEAGIRDYMNKGPLGFPLVDFSVNLYDGQYHAVDSSDMAFKLAAIVGMKEAMPNCDPVLLEPICEVHIYVPNAFTAKVQGLISKRRGQILGFDAKEGWAGWDSVSAHMPQAELYDIIIELRSLTFGVGTYEWKFDHLAELTGRIADDVVASRQKAA